MSVPGRTDIGLLPEFSTPVEKPVENAGKLALRTSKGRVLRHFFEAKARRSRFEAIFRERGQIPSASSGRG
jgi:hypothetical protein